MKHTTTPAYQQCLAPYCDRDAMCFNMVVTNAMGFEPKPDPLYTPTQPCKVFRVTRFTVLPATPRNLCNTLAGISHSLHHIEAHLPTLLGLATPRILWPRVVMVDNVLQYGESMLLSPGSLHIAIGWYPTFALATRPTILSGFAPFWSGYSEYPLLTLTLYHSKTIWLMGATQSVYPCELLRKDFSNLLRHSQRTL